MSDGERAIRRALSAACGNGGVPTDHAVEKIAGLIDSGSATLEMAQQCGGVYLVKRIEELKAKVTA